MLREWSYSFTAWRAAADLQLAAGVSRRTSRHPAGLPRSRRGGADAGRVPHLGLRGRRDRGPARRRAGGPRRPFARRRRRVVGRPAGAGARPRRVPGGPAAVQGRAGGAREQRRDPALRDLLRARAALAGGGRQRGRSGRGLAGAPSPDGRRADRRTRSRRAPTRSCTSIPRCWTRSSTARCWRRPTSSRP